MVGDDGPLLGTVDVDKVQEKAIFDVSPRPLDKRGVEDLLPPVQALYICPAAKALGDLFPVFAAVLLDGFSELFIFWFCPVAFNFDVDAGRILLFLVLSGSTLVQMGI